MTGRWNENAARRCWEARVYLADGSLSEVFALVDRTRLGCHWMRWPTRNVPYEKGFTNSNVEGTREAAMKAALVGVA